jgi:retron-type reverse transcriptase
MFEDSPEGVPQGGPLSPLLGNIMLNELLRRWNRCSPVNYLVDKAKSTEKIDGAVAMVIALDRCIRNEGVGGEKSVYGERGLLAF